MLETFTSFVTVLLALSVASERLVELVKGFIGPLNGKKLDANQERWRQLVVHLLSLVASCAVVLLAKDYIQASLNIAAFGDGEVAMFTILSSGGSSLWNSILSYLLSLKDLKQEDVAATRKAGNDDLAKGLPAGMPLL